MNRLTPSFWRLAIKVAGAITVFAVLAQWRSLGQGHWPDIRGLYSFVLPIVLAPTFVWYMFVPRLLEYSDEEIHLRTLLRQGSYRWEMLDAYGPGRGVFMLQFGGDSGAYQIMSGAYSYKEWLAFKTFLQSRFPDRKTSFSIGGKLIR